MIFARVRFGVLRTLDYSETGNAKDPLARLALVLPKPSVTTLLLSLQCVYTVQYLYTAHH